MKFKFQQPQGDLLFEWTKQAVPKGAKRMERDAHGRFVLAVSEVKGHTHAIYDPGVIAYMLDNGNMILDVREASQEKPVRIVGGTDEAHRLRLDAGPGTVPLPGEGHFPVYITEPGLYDVTRQREIDPWGEWQQATD